MKTKIYGMTYGFRSGVEIEAHSREEARDTLRQRIMIAQQNNTLPEIDMKVKYIKR